MLIEIADRFAFSADEIESMDYWRLKFWHNAVKKLVEAEERSRAAR